MANAKSTKKVAAVKGGKQGAKATSKAVVGYSEKELKAAAKMAGRKAGVSRKELSERLGCNPTRAGRILQNLANKGSIRAEGAKGGRKYFAKDAAAPEASAS